MARIVRKKTPKKAPAKTKKVGKPSLKVVKPKRPSKTPRPQPQRPSKTPRPQPRPPQSGLGPASRGPLAPPAIPWSEAQLDRIIEKACLFIAELKLIHGNRLGWEVGEYLYLHVYMGDVEYMFRRDPRKDRSLRDISAGSGVPVKSLSKWLRATIIRRRLAEHGIDTELGLGHLAWIYRFVQDMDVVIEVVDWAEATGVTVDELREHLEQGGTLDDMRPRVRDQGRAARRPRKGELLVPRLLDIVLVWAKKHTLAPRYKQMLRQEVLAIRTKVVAEHES